jgi:hypothetical protein
MNNTIILPLAIQTKSLFRYNRNAGTAQDTKRRNTTDTITLTGTGVMGGILMKTKERGAGRFA